MKLKELRIFLKSQKYPKIIVKKGIEKTLAIPQMQLRSEKFKNNGDVLPFISFLILILIEKCFRR